MSHPSSSRLDTPAALRMLAEIFEAPAPLQPASARDDIPGWDSMGALSLMAELDERFGISLSAERSRAMLRVDDVLALLREHGRLDD